MICVSPGYLFSIFFFNDTATTEIYTLSLHDAFRSRVVIYTDSVYREVDGVVYGELAFTLFQIALASKMERVTLVGRLDPGPGAARSALPSGVGFVGLPYYRSLTRPVAALSSLPRAVRSFWQALDTADCGRAFCAC